MQHRLNKVSVFARLSVLVFAAFFIVFASCPARKYVRFQLYKHHNTAHRTPGKDHVYVQDVKDCCIADKKSNVQKQVVSVAQQFNNDLISFFFSTSALPNPPHLFEKGQQIAFFQKPREGIATLVPLYIQIRHLQV